MQHVAQQPQQAEQSAHEQPAAPQQALSQHWSPQHDAVAQHDDEDDADAAWGLGTPVAIAVSMPAENTRVEIQLNMIELLWV